ncbi:hypothetical protein Sango_3100700 [Sesamum angolense]|uniref:DUF4283 domain-containing protein n=1 Tax=Sesamum angolense TaxID=2727404 RepID=A0AAE1W0C9_9LAMI|nr:hypothetical protein Sango_3100700 [Sesamum angolense]
MIREGSNRWNTTAVGYFLGKRPYFHHLNDFVRSIWPAVQDVKATSNGFFFFQFKIMAAMEEVLEGGPWLYLGQPIVLQKWEPGMVLRKLKHTEVPVWIKLRHLPVELWTTDGLSTVASGIGRPLYPDAITRACTRLDFAHVCVMLNVNSKLPKHIVIMMPNEYGGESACKVDVEYEWLPQNARTEKPNTCPAPRTGDPIPNLDPVFDQPVDKDDMMSNELPHKKTDKDYSGPGNRIWIAWNDDIIDVDILNIGSQFVHCQVLKHDMHEPIFLTVVYGANEVSARRELWQGLTELAVSVNCLDGRNLWKRLDCMFVNDAWLERWPNLFCTCLTPRTSDHSPLVLKGDSLDVQYPVFGTPMYSVTRKLKALKPVFRQQRRKKGDLAMNVKLAAGFLEIAQKLLQADRHNSLLLQLENCCRLVYLKATQLEHVMLRQRAKLQWLKGGDQCSKVFFRRVATRRANKRLFQISDKRVLDLHYLRPWARHILTEEEAYALIRPVTVDDVKKAMFDIEEDKAPGPDGKLLKQVNATVLTLIPKVRTPHSVADFRPISCCNVVYKVISKILVCRFREILDLLISPSQNAFVPGWTISLSLVCTELKLFQLSFADDLLLLCKADVQSVSLFRRGLDLFASLSGLHTNPQKSQLIIYKAASRLRDSLLETLGFQEGHLPVRSVQLIKSVLVSLEVYWAMAFILPKGIINEMIKRLRSFLWKGTSSNGYPKVAWEVVCRPIEEGGQGIKDIFALNHALMSKHLWAVIKQDRTSIWVDWIYQVRLRECSIWTAKITKSLGLAENAHT